MFVVFTLLLEAIRLYVGCNIGGILFCFYAIYIRKEKLPEDEDRLSLLSSNMILRMVILLIVFAILTYMEYHLIMKWR